jgi:uncharacterized protein YuzE
MPVAEYDRTSDALYIRLRDAEVARTTEVDDYRILDFDALGEVVGLEVLYPAANLTIAPIAREYGFADQLAEIDQAVAAAIVGPVAANVTVGITYMVEALVRGIAMTDVTPSRSIRTTAAAVLAPNPFGDAETSAPGDEALKTA